jgi:hypothetical protein
MIMTKLEHSPGHTDDGLLSLIFVVAAIVLIFNLSVLMALFLLQATALPPDTMADVQFRAPAASEIQKKPTTTTPKEDRESVRMAPGVLNRS